MDIYKQQIKKKNQPWNQAPWSEAHVKAEHAFARA